MSAQQDRPTQPPPPLERPDWMGPNSWREIEPELQRWEAAELRQRAERANVE